MVFELIQDFSRSCEHKISKVRPRAVVATYRYPRIGHRLRVSGHDRGCKICSTVFSGAQVEMKPPNIPQSHQ